MKWDPVTHYQYIRSINLLGRSLQLKYVKLIGKVELTTKIMLVHINHYRINVHIINIYRHMYRQTYIDRY